MQEWVQENVWVNDVVNIAEINRSVCQNIFRFQILGKQENLKKQIQDARINHEIFLGYVETRNILKNLNLCFRHDIDGMFLAVSFINWHIDG